MIQLDLFEEIDASPDQYRKAAHRLWRNWPDIDIDDVFATIMGRDQDGAWVEASVYVERTEALKEKA